MEINYGLFQTQSLKLNITQELIQAISVLQMSSLELTQFVEKLSIENPLLHVETNFYTTFDPHAHRKKRNLVSHGEPPNLEAFLTKETESLYDYLNSQTVTLNLTKAERECLQYLILNINENGYLEIELEDVCKILSCTEEVAKKALNIIHQLDPPGIGARNLKECILLQLKGMKQIHPKYITVISDYFLEFANKQWRKIEKETSLSLQEIQYLHDIVQTLNPRPGLSWSNAQTEYVVPDIIIEKRNHQWHIQIADESFFDIQVNKDYYEVLKEQTDAVVKSYLKEKYQQICWLKHALEQRKHTMLKMMRAIIEKQGDYFLNPNTPLKPMTMIEIANKIGVHESTVSRMTKNKYVKAPMGTIHLRTLFTARIHPKNSGGGFSTDAIKRQLVEIINNEDKKTPYSDQKILEILREKGINVSRRTIAKYRDLLHIPSSTKRKRYS